jgi:hypothetical protein
MGSSQDIAGGLSGRNGCSRWSEREPESRVPAPCFSGAVLLLNAGCLIFSASARFCSMLCSLLRLLRRMKSRRNPLVHIEREPEAIAWSIVFPVATFSWLSVAIHISFQVSSSISIHKPICMEMKYGGAIMEFQEAGNPARG